MPGKGDGIDGILASDRKVVPDGAAICFDFVTRHGDRAARFCLLGKARCLSRRVKLCFVLTYKQPSPRTDRTVLALLVS
jgi:hypothetical protein